MQIKQLYQLFIKSDGAITDTRKIKKNTLFFALKGENFNGNSFAEEALKKGASHAIIDDEKYNTNPNTILVDDVLQTLQKLANYHRQKLNIPIISLTGSNGKTTTKELINAVLSQKYNTVATQGNLNNHIGVPLTLLSMTQKTEIGIVEMGANHQKEIAFLANITNPNYGVITNFGKAHIEGFKGIKGVIKGKSELYDYLIKNQQFIFYNLDDAIQTQKLNTYPNKKSFGQTTNADITIKFLSANPFVTLSCNDEVIQTQLIGSYNFTNIAIAITIGNYFNVPQENIKKAIENYVPSNNRSQLIAKNSNTIILDAYNANPTSMKAALDNFANLPDNNKIAFLGDMFELGKDALKEHQDIALYAEKLGLEDTFLIGENFYNVKTNLKKYKNLNELVIFLKNISLKNKTILIKGSRGMTLERILDFI